MTEKILYPVGLTSESAILQRFAIIIGKEDTPAAAARRSAALLPRLHEAIDSHCGLRCADAVQNWALPTRRVKPGLLEVNELFISLHPLQTQRIASVPSPILTSECATFSFTTDQVKSSTRYIPQKLCEVD
ncbi:unnamed protein product [Plutella xylostella]|uniref:(diamondback moth) hypothetical protein n=1 Tax=Plutella xylostella TaxID=51655 RepID=A0A8S4DDC4_PLUXY|nr:unnamed protein product [Plutella xylostella]